MLRRPPRTTRTDTRVPCTTPVRPAATASQLFDEGWQRHGLSGPLGAIDPGPRYWYEEVSAVLKGRGIAQFEQYANLARLGRHRALTRDQRAAEIGRAHV